MQARGGSLPQQRPDRWQHPTTRHTVPEVSPCPDGGVHRWRLLILGASAVIRWAGRRGASGSSWLARMLARKPTMLVIVALANKTARIVWALLGACPGNAVLRGI